MKRTTSEIVVIMFAATVSIVVVSAALSWAIRGPEAVPDAARDYLREILILMIGGVIGYIAKSTKTAKPDDTANTTTRTD